MVGFHCGDRKKLKFFLNERPIHLEGCPQGACDSEDFLSHYGRDADQDFDLICQKDEAEDRRQSTEAEDY